MQSLIHLHPLAAPFSPIISNGEQLAKHQCHPFCSATCSFSCVSMTEETPARMTTGYRVLNDQEEGGEMDLSPVSFHNDLQHHDGAPLIHDTPLMSNQKPRMFATPHFLSGEDDVDQPEQLLMPLTSLSPRPASLNGLNFLNVVTYLAHLFVSYGIGVWGLNGVIPTRWQISKEYETLVTPAKYAYFIWAPILLSETVFAVAQLLPNYRARPIIQQGTKFFFFYTCLIQTAWTLFFAFRLFIFSFASVVAAFVSLVLLLVSQHYSQVRGQSSRSEYWLFQFPFVLHCGWMAVMVAVHLSLLLRHVSISNLGTQLAGDIVALCILLPVVSYALSVDSSATNFVIPTVVLWAYVSIPE
jgi:hypothetical protein